jgi:hypothetical protein
MDEATIAEQARRWHASTTNTEREHATLVELVQGGAVSGISGLRMAAITGVHRNTIARWLSENTDEETDHDEG